MRSLVLVVFLLATALAFAQEPATPAAAPTASPRVVRLHFAVPPLEGTISLGIYDTSGKLVRVLHREDTVSDLIEGHDALETTWDGNDDAGNPLPAGRYHARGYLVGDEVRVEGVETYFNDWVMGENSPRIAHIERIAFRDGALHLTATTADGKRGEFLFDAAQKKLLPVSQPLAPEPIPLSAAAQSALINPVASAPGEEGSLWAISHVAKDEPALEIVQVAATDQSGAPILRTLAIEPAAPQPVGIAASPNGDHIYLLEDSPALQRVRSLSLLATEVGEEQATSDWKVDFDKEIVAHKNFALQNGKPVVASPNESPKGPANLPQKLRPNPLERDLPGRIALAVGFDADGSFLKTADGLPLRTISDTPNLTRVLLVRQAENAADVFQDDRAVVEQFRITHLDQMLAFDCGEFDLK
ncbi:MAG: hypothetical protein ABI233_04350 [Chthoniobacterales bacterium]